MKTLGASLFASCLAPMIFEIAAVSESSTMSENSGKRLKLS